jgi:hypothetical protein
MVSYRRSVACAAAEMYLASLFVWNVVLRPNIVKQLNLQA